MKSIACVINFDIAPTLDDHIHRVGWTGWDINEGLAYNLILKKERLEAEWLLKHLEIEGQVIPDNLKKLVEKDWVTIGLDGCSV